MRDKKVRFGALAIFLAAFLCVARPVAAGPSPQSAEIADQTKLIASTERFLRQLYAWGPDVTLKPGPLTPSKADAFYVLPIEVTLNGQTESGQVYVSKDGKTLLQGDLFDTSTDPYAANRAQIHLEGNPARGPADAVVTLVEFADFECPSCHQLYENLKEITARYPQMRVVYKDFPLTSIHPWAATAAVGGRCAFMQSPDAFWKVHDLIFDNQDVISPENVWDKLVSFAAQSGLNADAFKACLSSPDAQKAVDANRAEGAALGIHSTPTVYVNGRPVVGGNPAAITQDIDFELAQKEAAAK
jgi:protein-disulfide isomerase